MQLASSRAGAEPGQRSYSLCTHVTAMLLLSARFSQPLTHAWDVEVLSEHSSNTLPDMSYHIILCSFGYVSLTKCLFLEGLYLSYDQHRIWYTVGS